MKFEIITIFPDLINQYLQHGLLGQAVLAGKISCSLVNPRKFTSDIHQTVDDRPFGGGDGMIMKPEPIVAALEDAYSRTGLERRVIYVSPQGRLWNDNSARLWAREARDTGIICGRYGGSDRRIIHQFVDEEISVGDYVLSGGELPALVLMESVSRFLDGVLGNETSLAKDSFAQGLFEAPQFTRPREFSGDHVPSFLLSGNHKLISEINHSLSIVLTAEKRPDLAQNIPPKTLQTALGRLRDLSEEELRLCGLRGEENE